MLVGCGGMEMECSGWLGQMSSLLQREQLLCVLREREQLLYVLMEPGQVGVEVAVVGVDVVGLVVVAEGTGLVAGGWRCCPVVVKMLLLLVYWFQGVLLLLDDDGMTGMEVMTCKMVVHHFHGQIPYRHIYKVEHLHVIVGL